MGLLASWSARWCFTAAAVPMLAAGIWAAGTADARALTSAGPAEATGDPEDAQSPTVNQPGAE